MIIDKRAEKLVDAGTSPLAAKLEVLEEVGSPTLVNGQVRNALYLFTP